MSDEFAWSETERMFEALMTSCNDLLTTEHRKEIAIWLDNNEFSLALETLVDILSEKPAVPKEIIQRIKVLAIHVGLTELSLADLKETA